jgi:hypothetical protein
MSSDYSLKIINMKNLLIVLIVFLSVSCSSPHDKIMVCVAEVNDSLSIVKVTDPNCPKVTLFVKKKDLPVKKGDFILVRRGEVLNY